MNPWTVAGAAALVVGLTALWIAYWFIRDAERLLQEAMEILVRSERLLEDS